METIVSSAALKALEVCESLDEEVIYSSRSKLYRFENSAWAEKGIGDAKLLKCKSSGKVRLTFWDQQSGNRVLNQYIVHCPPFCVLKRNAGSATCLVWLGQDCTESPAAHQFALKFATSELASQFTDEFNSAKDLNAAIPDFAALFPLAVGASSLHGVSANTAALLSGPASPEVCDSGQTGSLFSAGTSSWGLFGATTNSAAGGNIFGTIGGTSSGNFWGGGTAGGGLCGGHSGGSQSGFLLGTSAFASPGVFGPTIPGGLGSAGLVTGECTVPVVTASKEAGDDDQYVEEEEVTTIPGWQASVTLEVKDRVETGEEDEDELYSQRSKLYRFRDNEWKERGVGEAKLLKHRVSGKVRFFMRQEMTHKMVANHYVINKLPYCDLKPNAGSDKSFVWVAQDNSDDDIVTEKFGLRFGTAELAQKFQEAFANAKLLNAKVFHLDETQACPAQSPKQSPTRCPEAAPLSSPAQAELFSAVAASQPSLVTPSFGCNLSVGKQLTFGGSVEAASGVFGTNASSLPLFGASVSTGGLFGLPSSGGGLFGSMASSGSLFSGSLFGGTVSSGGLFGAAASSGSLFGSSIANAGLFSTPAAPVASSAPGPTNEDDEGEFVPEEELTVIPGWEASVTLEVKENVELGVEEEDELYSQRSKLFRFRDGEWKERGLGDAKLLRHRTTGKVRFVMRQEKTLKLVGNHVVIDVSPYCDLQPNVGNEKCWVWSAQDWSEEDMVVERFALKFGTKELALEFKNAFDHAKELNAKAFEASGAKIDHQGVNGSSEVAMSKSNLPTPTPSIRPSRDLAPVSAVSPNAENPFAGLSFSSDTTSSSPFAQFSSEKMVRAQDDEELFSAASTLYKFRDDKWKECSLVTAKLVTHKASGKVRFVAKDNKSKKIVANHYVVLHDPYCELKPCAGGDTGWIWTAQDGAESTRIETFGLKFTTASHGAEFKQKFDQAKTANALLPEFKEFTSVFGEGDNSLEVDHVAFKGDLIDSTRLDGAQEKVPLSLTISLQSGSTTATIVGPASGSSSAPSSGGLFSGGLFGGAGTLASSRGLFDTPASGNNLFGGSSAPLGSSLFSSSASNGGTFSGGALVSSSSSLFGGPALGGLFGGTSNVGLFGNASTGGLFGSCGVTAASPQVVATGDEDEFVPEEELVVIPGWEASVTLEVKDHVASGEEDEEELYSQRAKLYRFSDGEWKERGLGDAKLLKHRTERKVRFILRQEKTLKVVANHCVIDIPPYCDLKAQHGNDKIWVWSAQDWAGDEMVVERFALKFGSPELALGFKSAFDEAKVANKAFIDDTKRVLPKSGSTATATPTSKASVSATQLSKAVSKASPKTEAQASPKVVPKAHSEQPQASTAPCAGGLFGGPAFSSGGGLFGSASLFSLPSGGGVFGAIGASPSGAGIFSHTGGGLFGEVRSSGSLFGTPAVGGLFGASVASTGGGLFGAASGFAFQSAGGMCSAGCAQSNPFGGGLTGVKSGESSASPAAQQDEADKDELVVEEELTEIPGWIASVTLDVQDRIDTGEERDEVVYVQRSKLLRFRDGEWKERGLGDAKLLLNKANGLTRFLMRQEKTMKLVANHYLIDQAPYCDLRPNAGSEKCLVWTALDCSDDEKVVEQFALKFASAELANEFKLAFDKAKKQLPTTGARPGGPSGSTAAAGASLDSKKDCQKVAPEDNDEEADDYDDGDAEGWEESGWGDYGDENSAPPASDCLSALAAQQAASSGWRCTSCRLTWPEDSIECAVCEIARPGFEEQLATKNEQHQKAKQNAAAAFLGTSAEAAAPTGFGCCAVSVGFGGASSAGSGNIFAFPQASAFGASSKATASTPPSTLFGSSPIIFGTLASNSNPSATPSSTPSIFSTFGSNGTFFRAPTSASSSFGVPVSSGSLFGSGSSSLSASTSVFHPSSGGASIGAAASSSSLFGSPSIVPPRVIPAVFQESSLPPFQEPALPLPPPPPPQQSATPCSGGPSQVVAEMGGPRVDGLACGLQSETISANQLLTTISFLLRSQQALPQSMNAVSETELRKFEDRMRRVEDEVRTFEGRLEDRWRKTEERVGRAEGLVDDLRLSSRLESDRFRHDNEIMKGDVERLGADFEQTRRRVADDETTIRRLLQQQSEDRACIDRLRHDSEMMKGEMERVRADLDHTRRRLADDEATIQRLLQQQSEDRAAIDRLREESFKERESRRFDLEEARDARKALEAHAHAMSLASESKTTLNDLRVMQMPDRILYYQNLHLNKKSPPSALQGPSDANVVDQFSLRLCGRDSKDSVTPFLRRIA